MRRDANRVVSLLGQRRIVDDKKTCLVADQAIGLLQQGRLEGSTVPHPGGHEMVQLIVADIAYTRSHRLDALAITRPDQAGNVERAHPAPRRVRKPCQKRLKPSLQIAPPLRVRYHRQSARMPIPTRQSRTIPTGSLALPK